MAFDESTSELAALEWLKDLGYAVAFGPDLAPGEPGAERDSFGDVVLTGRLKRIAAALNPGIPESAVDEGIRRLLGLPSPSTPG